MESSESKFKRILDIIKQLRDPVSGCPWDKAQTHESLREYVVEEAYELVEAIDHKPDQLADELGDLLLQVLLHSQIAADENKFDISTVIDILIKKMEDRHPHIFGNTKLDTASEVVESWNSIKLKNKDSLLDGLSQTLPSLLEAHKIGNRVKEVFDFPSLADARAKLYEEVDELIEAIDHNHGQARIEEELGDLLFTVAQLGRMYKLNAEISLTKANKKFSNRFQWMEKNSKKPFAELTREEKEKLWLDIKKLSK
ncbi:MAG: nucleoside triphosphate pyrophosphohydrolase [Bdellovibrionales bacterium]|nr:nucleoside triphosphate pyrophosphohydrolase [Bdellovibrionales bacterium]